MWRLSRPVVGPGLIAIGTLSLVQGLWLRSPTESLLLALVVLAMGSAVLAYIRFNRGVPTYKLSVAAGGVIGLSGGSIISAFDPPEPATQATAIFQSITIVLGVAIMIYDRHRTR